MLNDIFVLDIGENNKEINKKQIDFFYSISDSITYASKYFSNNNHSYASLLNQYFSDHENEKVLIIKPDIEITLAEIEEMVNVMNQSERYAFSTIYFNDEYTSEEYVETDFLDDILVIINTKYPCMIGNVKNQDSFFETLQNYINYMAEYGFQLVAVNNGNFAVKNEKKTVLIFEDAVIDGYNGTSTHYTGILEGIYSTEKYDITICAKESIRKFHSLTKYGLKILSMDQVIECYDIVFIPAHAFSMSQSDFLRFIDLHARKIIIWPLDSILFRCNKNTVGHKLVNTYKKLSEFADGMIFLSEDAKSDYNNLFKNSKNLKKIPQIINYLPARKMKKLSESNKYENYIPFNNYVLIIGNTNKHKMINQIINVIKRTEEKYIIVGASEEGWISDNIFGYKSGSLCEEFFVAINVKCKYLIFPSIYEGLGLPIIDALNFGKDVVVVNNKLNIEIESLCPKFKGHLHYYNTFREMKRIIENDMGSIHKNPIKENAYKRTWDDVGNQLLQFFDDILAIPDDNIKIQNRHVCFDVLHEADQNIDILKDRLFVLQQIVLADYLDISTEFIIDIYGCGINGRTLRNYLEQTHVFGCFVDSNNNNRSNVEMEVVPINNYIMREGHILVVTPIYDFEKIKETLSKNSSIDPSKIISVVDFLRGKIF